MAAESTTYWQCHVSSALPGGLIDIICYESRCLSYRIIKYIFFCCCLLLIVCLQRDEREKVIIDVRCATCHRSNNGRRHLLLHLIFILGLFLFLGVYSRPTEAPSSIDCPLRIWNFNRKASTQIPPCLPAGVVEFLLKLSPLIFSFSFGQSLYRPACNRNRNRCSFKGGYG